jgi:hypothetical protein
MAAKQSVDWAVGKRDSWIDPRSEDHATGLNLQLDELRAQRERARRQGDISEVHAAELEITALQLELADAGAQPAPETHRLFLIRDADTAEDLMEKSKGA